MFQGAGRVRRRRRCAPAASCPSIGYLNEPARAHLGLRRRAAGLPGLLRRPDQDRRPAAALAGADRPLRRARRRDRHGHAASPATTATATASARRRCSPTSATTSATSASWRAGVVAARTPRRRSPLRRRQRRRHAGHATASPARAAPGALDAIYKWAPERQRDASATSSCRASTSSAHESGTLSYDTLGAGRRDVERRLRARRRAAGTCRASTSSCRRGASACATTGSIRARRASAWSTSGTLTAGRLPDPAAARGRRAAPLMVDYSPSEFSRLRLQLARRPQHARRRPITRSSCNTS